MPDREDRPSVERPDLARRHGTKPTDKTHREGEHRPRQDAPDGDYTGEHGERLPRQRPRE